MTSPSHTQGDWLRSRSGDWEEDSDWKEINEAIERRREKGMGLAGHVAALDEGHGWFSEEDEGDVLATF